jgi:hypothetical protein
MNVENDWEPKHFGKFSTILSLSKRRSTHQGKSHHLTDKHI